MVDNVEVDAEALAAYLRPRDDLVTERAAGEGTFELEHGPFDRYSRTVVVAPGRRST